MEVVDVRGRFVWHQLMTRDVPGARKFYSKLIGWKALPWPLDPNYTVCHAESGPVAGIMEIPADMPAEMPAHWMQYIGTRDVDGTADAVVRAGGSVVKAPGEMKGAGRYAILKDPQGAVFAIIDPENARPDPPGVPPIGTFSWHELATSDNEAAFAFYSEIFGWDVLERMDMGPTGVYLIFGQNGVQRGGIYIKPSDWPAPPNWMPYAHVPNVDHGHAVSKATGANTLVPPMDIPGGRIASLMDPAGAPFAIHSMAPVAAEAAKAAKPTAKPKPKAKPAVKAKAKVKPKAKVKAKMKAKAKAKAKAKPKAKPKAKGKASRKPSAKKKAPARKKSKTVRRKK